MADSPKPPKRGLLARVRNFLYRTPVGVALHRPTPQLQASDDDKKRTSKIATGGSAECGADEPEPGHATLPNMTEEDDSHPESGSPNEGATNDLPLVERHNGIPEATNVIDSAPHREHPLTIPPATKSGPYEHQDRVLAALRNSEGSLYGHMMPTLPEMYEKELSPESSDNDEKEVSLPSRDEDPIKTAYIADSMTDAGNLDLKQRIKEKTSAGPSQAPAMEELSPPAAENTKELKNKIDSMIGELKDQIDQRTSARNAESCRYFADENAQPESTTPGVHVSSSPVDTTKELEDKVNRMISDLRKKIEQNILAEFTETSEALAHKKSQPGSTSLGGSNVRHQIPMQDEELVKLPEHEEKYRKPSSCGDPKIEVTRQQRLGGLNRLSKAVYAFMENVVRTQTLRPDKRDQETFEDFLRSLGDPVLFEAFRQMIPELNWDQSIMKHADNDMITQLLIRTKDQRPLPPPKQSQAVSEGIDEVSRIANELREARQEEAAAIACISFSAFEYMQTFIRPQLATDTQIEEWLHMLEEPRFFQACSRAIPELRWDQSIVEHDSNDIITLMLVVTKNQRPPPPLRRFPDERTLKPRTGSQYPGRITMVKVPVINIQGPFQNREMISDLKEIVEHTKLEYGTDRGFARAFTDGIMGGMMMSGIVTMKIGREVEEAVYNQCLANLERRPDRLFRLEHVLYPRTARSTMDVPDEQVMGSIWARLVEDTCRRLYSP